MTWRPRIFGVLRELYNYFEFRKVIKKEKLDSPKWSKLRLRYDWLGRIYTVVNLPPEILNSRDFPVEGRPAYVMDEVGPINEYLGTELNLNEIITVSFDPIEKVEGKSFLVVYYFVFRSLTLMWILRVSLILTGIVLSVVHKDFLYEWILKFTT